MAVGDCTANNYASHNARMMLVLHNFKVIRPTVADDFFLQTVAKSVWDSSRHARQIFCYRECCISQEQFSSE